MKNNRLIPRNSTLKLISVFFLLYGIFPNINAIEFPTQNPDNGTKCISYTFTIELDDVVGSLISFNDDGNLPAGLSFSSDLDTYIGTISGIPTELVTNKSFTLTANDEYDEFSKNYIITIINIDAGGPGKTCEGVAYQITGVTIPPPLPTITWSGGTGSFDDNSIENPLYTPGSSETGSVTLTLETNGTCPTSDDHNLTINPLPTASVSGDASICNGESTDISITLSGTGPWDFTYTDGTTPVNNTNQASSPYTVSVSPAVTTTYSVTAVNNANCTGTDFGTTATVTVNDLPTASVSGDALVCQASTGNVYTTQAGMSNYSWSVSSGGTITTGGGTGNNTVTVTWVTTGSQSVSVNYTNLNGCSASSPTIYNVTVFTLPNLTLTCSDPDNTINEGESVTFTAGGGTTYEFFIDGINVKGPGIENTYTTTSLSNGDVVTVKVTNANGCVNTHPGIMITFYHNPFDIIFVLDISGSMYETIGTGGPTKLQKLRDAIQIFFENNLGEIESNDQVAAIYFATQVNQVDANLVNWLTNGNNLKASILSQSCSGICWTAMGGGLQAAINELLSEVNDHTKNIFLITDGKQNLNPVVNDAVNPMLIEDDPDPYYDTHDSGIDPASPLTALDGSNGIRIYTIGLDATGDIFTMLNDIAINTGGITNLTLADPNMFDQFLTENFVDVLRESSPQIVDYRYRQLTSSNAVETFTVNKKADRITLKLLGDRGDPDFYHFRVEKDGTDITDYGNKSDGEFYRIFTIDLPAVTPAGKIDPGGIWQMKFNGNTGRNYQVACIVSEHKFNYKCTAEPKKYFTGQPLKLEAKVNYQGIPVSDAEVTCFVLKPGEDLGTLMAETSIIPGRFGRNFILQKDLKYIQKFTRKQIVNNDYFLSPAEYKLHLLLQSEAFLNKLQSTQHTVRLNYSKGKYTGEFTDTELNGAYRLIFRILWKDEELGVFERMESSSIMVEFGEPDSDQSETFAIPPCICYKNWRIGIRPVDKFGNLLGPGYAEKIYAGENTRVIDNLEGSYTIIFNDKNIPHDADISLQLHQRKFYSGKLNQINTKIPKEARRLKRRPNIIKMMINK